MFLALDMGQAKKYIEDRKKKLYSTYDAEDIAYVEPNLKRKYPVFIRESGVDMRGARGRIDVWVEFYPVTKDMKTKFKSMR